MLTKKTLSIFLEIIFLVFGLWISAYQETKAGDEIYCFLKSGNCVSNYEPCIFCSSYTDTCTVNASNNNIDENTFSQLSSCATGGNKCQTGTCPSDNTNLSNGDSCQVRKYVGGVKADNGLWDLSDTKCMGCAFNNVELFTCGDASDIYLTEMPLGSGNWQCSGAGDGKFESACGADAACDEQNAGFVCGAGKSCDANGKCVAAAACNTNPTVEIIPVSQNSAAGTALVYTIKVTNIDDATCATASRTFNLTSAKPGAAWGDSFSALNVTAAKGGGSNTVNYTLTSPVSASEQSFPFQISANDPSGASTALGIYTVTTCSSNTFIEFDKDIYKIGAMLQIDFTIGAAEPTNDYARCVYNNTGNNKWDSPIAHFFGSANLGGNVNTAVGNTLGTWTTSLVAGTVSCPGVPSGCIGATKVVECLVDADCASNDCDLTTNTCVAAAVCNNDGDCDAGDGETNANCPADCPAAGPPACPSNRDACEDIVPNLALPCNCGTTTINAGELKYCCGATNGVFNGDAAGLATCQTACAASPTCAAGDGCLAGCVPADPDCAGCTANSGACPGGNSDCCSNNCVGGVCTAIASVATCSGPGMFVSPLGPGYCTIGEILTKATNWILALVSSIIILIIIIGGLMYISSAGDEEKLRTSKNIIFYAIVGLGIILISYALITEVTDILKGP